MPESAIPSLVFSIFPYEHFLFTMTSPYYDRLHSLDASPAVLPLVVTIQNLLSQTVIVATDFRQGAPLLA